MNKVANRVTAEARFFANTIREAVLHPLSASVIDKRTGRVIKALDSPDFEPEVTREDYQRAKRGKQRNQEGDISQETPEPVGKEEQA